MTTDRYDTPQTIEAARAWLADDPDPATRGELESVVAAASTGDPTAVTDLEDRFSGMLAFGTAGLRGELGAGPNRMNIAVVIRAAAGIAAWVADGHRVDGDDPSVAICFDARHRSRDMAEVSARVLAAAGIRALVLPGPLPTPVLAFAVRDLGAAAGVMVTASHNPPQDNGYKVYGGDGRQIVAPVDQQIAAVIDGIDRVSEVPLADADDPRIVHLGDEVVARYVEAAAAVSMVEGARDVTVAYTAMHGVGAATFRRVFEAAGFPPAIEVAEQVEPDPAFPTVAFPNPEEPGALDLGLAEATARKADVLLANDPDADRLGVAVPDRALGPTDSPAGWRVLRGDEIGAVLADHLFSHDPVLVDSARTGGWSVATTIVSSTLLSRMAAAAGVDYRETLTGFKWISRAADDLRFGYEEALGYAVAPDVVADKDGITAAVLFAEAVAVQAERGRTVIDVLDDLARHHGLHRTSQWSVRISAGDAMATLAAVMETLRADPPTELAGAPVLRLVDLLEGSSDGSLPPSDVLIMHLDGARIVVRPSGTEPKLKCYLEVIEAVDGQAPDGLDAARTRADARLGELTTAIAAAVGFAP